MLRQQWCIYVMIEWIAHIYTHPRRWSGRFLEKNMIKRGGGYTTGLMDDRYTHNPRVLFFSFFFLPALLLLLLFVAVEWFNLARAAPIGPSGRRLVGCKLKKEEPVRRLGGAIRCWYLLPLRSPNRPSTTSGVMEKSRVSRRLCTHACHVQPGARLIPMLVTVTQLF